MDGGHDQRPEAARPRVVPVRVDTYEPSSGIVTGVLGVFLLVAGGMITLNVLAHDDSDLSLAAGLALAGAGLYCLVAGAVARGVQMARQAAPPVQTPVHDPHPPEET